MVANSDSLGRKLCAFRHFRIENGDFRDRAEFRKRLDALRTNQAGTGDENLHRSMRLSLSASARSESCESVGYGSLTWKKRPEMPSESGESSQRHNAMGLEKGTTVRTSPPAARTAASMEVSLAPGAMMLMSMGVCAASSSM